MAAPTATSPRAPSQPIVGSYSYAEQPTLDATYAIPFDAVFVNAAATVVIRLLDGTDITFAGLPAGSVLPVRGVSIRTGSTVAQVRCLWA